MCKVSGISRKILPGWHLLLLHPSEITYTCSWAGMNLTDMLFLCGGQGLYGFECLGPFYLLVTWRAELIRVGRYRSVINRVNLQIHFLANAKFSWQFTGQHVFILEKKTLEIQFACFYSTTHSLEYTWQTIPFPKQHFLLTTMPTETYIKHIGLTNKKETKPRKKTPMSWWYKIWSHA